MCLFIGPSVSMNHGVEGGVAPVMLREVNRGHDGPATARRMHQRACIAVKIIGGVEFVSDFAEVGTDFKLP